MSEALLVVLNGSSASGKSCLIGRAQRRARELAVVGNLRCARRATTRGPRVTEALPTENRHLDQVAFEREVESGALDVHWRRTTSPGQAIRYGFAVGPEIARGGVIVLSANNYLDWQAQPLLAALREQGRLMVIRVWASRETRQVRLRTRHPAPSASELASRLDDVPADALPPADHVIFNDHPFEAHSEWDLLNRMAAFRFPTVPRPWPEFGPPVLQGAS